MRHSWMQIAQTPGSDELEPVISFSPPEGVDPDIVEQMSSLGFPREQAMDSVVNNRYDVAASTYYLLLSRKTKARTISAPQGEAQVSPQAQQPAAQRPSRGARGHKRHHTVDVPFAEMEASAPTAHGDPLRDPAPQMNVKSRHPVPPPPTPASAQPHGPPQPVVPPTITLTPTPRVVNEQAGRNEAPTGAKMIPEPAASSNPGLLPFWRQRGHHRSRSVDTTSSGMHSPPLHDYTSHIIKEATILNSSPSGSRASRRSPSLSKSGAPSAHLPPGHHSPNQAHHPLPPDIARVKAAARRRSMRPKSVGPWSPAAEASPAIPSAPSHALQPSQGEAEEESSLHSAEAPKEELHRMGHRRAQSYDIRAHKPKAPPESPSASSNWSGESDEDNPLVDDTDPARRADQAKNSGTLNSLVNSLKSGLGLLRGRGEKEREPRSIRFALNVSTTSAKSADEIMQEVSRVLAQNNLTFTSSAYCAHCTCDDVHFEVEVCKLPMLSMNGIRFNRISGDAWAYKRVAAKLIEQMEL